MELSAQIDELVRENRENLRARQASESCYRQLKIAYDELANEVSHIRTTCANQVQEAIIERDRAVTRANEVNALMNRVADIILQAARASVGDSFQSDQVDDPRLPKLELDQIVLGSLAVEKLTDDSSRQDVSRVD